MTRGHCVQREWPRRMADVFISYKRRLRPLVERLAQSLSTLGVSVWFDAELEPGRSFSAEISEEVRNARCVVVCWSDDAFHHGGDENGWVVGEATIGKSRKVLVPVLIEPADLDPPWNTFHTEDLTAWVHQEGGTDRWRNVLTAIGRHVGRPGLGAYDVALEAGSDDALRAWAKTYPDDPEVSRVKREITARQRARRRRAKPSRGPGKQTAVQVLPSDDSIVEEERGGAGTISPQRDALVSEDVRSAWLERDAALTTDLAFERQQLEEAVGSALGVIDATVASTDVPRSDTGPLMQPEARAIPSRALAVPFALCGTVVSGILFFILVHTDYIATPMGTFSTGIASAAVYGGGIGATALILGHISFTRWAVLLFLTPAFAFGSIVTAAVLSHVLVGPHPLVAIACGFGAAFVGAFALSLCLVALRALYERPLRELVLWSAVVAAPLSLLEGLGVLGSLTNYDLCFTVVVWETTFAIVFSFLVVPPRRLQKGRWHP
jgi:hypothetical protein